MIHVHCLTAAKWEPDWSETAVKLVEDCRAQYYRPSNFEMGPDVSTPPGNTSLFALHVSALAMFASIS